MLQLYEKKYLRIQDLCKKSGYSINSMCKKLGISRSCLSELKAGRTKDLSYENYEIIAKFFGVSVSYLTLSDEASYSENTNSVKSELKRRVDSLSDEQAEAFLKIIKTL
ncbi:MAG: helix-turn-helix domain-containing protein [Clostridia bacterium]|nr:helix-turn-helix domain-containing protein [Clostridia bacterium]